MNSTKGTSCELDTYCVSNAGYVLFLISFVIICVTLFVCCYWLQGESTNEENKKRVSLCVSVIIAGISCVVVGSSIFSNTQCTEFGSFCCGVVRTFRMFTFCSHLLFALCGILLVVYHIIDMISIAPLCSPIPWLIYTYTHIAFLLYFQFWSYATLDSGRDYFANHYKEQLQHRPVLTENHIVHALPLLLAFVIWALNNHTMNTFLSDRIFRSEQTFLNFETVGVFYATAIFVVFYSVANDWRATYQISAGEALFLACTGFFFYGVFGAAVYYWYNYFIADEDGQKNSSESEVTTVSEQRKYKYQYII